MFVVPHTPVPYTFALDPCTNPTTWHSYLVSRYQYFHLDLTEPDQEQEEDDIMAVPPRMLILVGGGSQALIALPPTFDVRIVYVPI